MRVVCVVPARIGSTRLPNKPLQMIAGEALIRRVVRRVLNLDCLDHVVVATDDRRVASVVADLVDTALTSGRHGNGTERVAEVAQLERFRAAPFIVNVQGDEPFLPADLVRGVVQRIVDGAAIATGACPLGDGMDDRNTVKVQVDDDGFAQRFFRLARPDESGPEATYRHLGVYAYRREALMEWARAPMRELEARESLEQLRPMASGRRIAVHVVDQQVPRGVDTMDDVHEANRYLSRTLEQVSA